MKNIDKVGLIAIQGNKILVVRNKDTSQFLLPGGKREDFETDRDTLSREIKEELNTTLTGEIKYIGEFTDEAANHPGKLVNIKAYQGNLSGEINPTSEVEEIMWFDIKKDDKNILSRIVKNRILPKLIELNMF